MNQENRVDRFVSIRISQELRPDQVPPNTVWSRRPPLRSIQGGHACGGVGGSGGFRQRRWVDAAHTNR